MKYFNFKLIQRDGMCESCAGTGDYDGSGYCHACYGRGYGRS